MNYFSRGIVATITISLTVALIPAVGLAARTREAALGAVTIKTLRVDEPAILATNPFYWFTDIGQSMRETFTSGRLGKALSRGETLNKKAAEFLKLQSVAADNQKARIRAVSEYQLGVYQFALALAKLNAEEVDFDSMQTLSRTSLLNIRMMDDLLGGDISASERVILMDAFDRLTDAIIKLYSQSKDLVSLLDVLGLKDESSFERIRFAETLALVAKRAAGTHDDVGQELLVYRLTLLNSFVAELRDSGNDFSRVAPSMMMAMSATPKEASNDPVKTSVSIDSLTKLAGSAPERSNTISYLLSFPELANNVQLIDLKNAVLMKVFAN